MTEINIEENTNEQKGDPRKIMWLEEMKKINPDVSPYFLDFMIDVYLLDPRKAEAVISNHKYNVEKGLIPDVN